MEGGTSSHYKLIKQMAFDSPLIFHTLLNTITDSVIEYVKYQAGGVLRTSNRPTFHRRFLFTNVLYHCYSWRG